MKNAIRIRTAKRIRGQGMTEYIIIVALIAIAAIAVTSLFGGTVRSQIAGMAQEMSGTSANAQIGNAKAAAQKAAETANDTKDKTTLGNYNEAGSEVLE